MPLHTRVWRLHRRRSRLGRADLRRRRRWALDAAKIAKEVDRMTRADFEALWALLDAWEDHAKELRRRWPGCPVDGLVSEVLRLRHWATMTWTAEHDSPAHGGA